MHTHELPGKILLLLDRWEAPDILIRHLTLVHSTSRELMARVLSIWPELSIDQNLIFFGAATHDIGKLVIPAEIHHPGKLHEAKGKQFLLQAGYDAVQARFSLTHGSEQYQELDLEDLFVILSDKIWKGKRIQELEACLSQKIATVLDLNEWEIIYKLDSILMEIALGADERILWQKGQI